MHEPLSLLGPRCLIAWLGIGLALPVQDEAAPASSLTAQEYASALAAHGVDMPADELARRARACFHETRLEMQGLAARIAARDGVDAPDYRDVIRRLRAEPIAPGELIAHYAGRVRALRRLVERHGVVTLYPQRLEIRAASEAEREALAAPRLRTPALADLATEPAEFVIPIRRAGDGESGERFADWDFDAASWTIAAHEAFPGHVAQFQALARAAQAGADAPVESNTANVEGWALYMEAEMQPYLPVEGQLIALQYRLLRTARALLDPALHLDGMSEEEALRVLREDVLLSESSARQELERYTRLMPGQAPSYFCGYLRLLELRTETEHLLRDRFDRREYHDYLLAQGLIPLQRLRERVLREYVPRVLERSPMPPLLIRDVTVVDPMADSRRGMSVLIRGGRVAAVAPDDRLSPPPNARTIDGSGRYLIPGLWDMHVHLGFFGDEALALLVANGVTGVRDLGSDPDAIRDLRRRIEEGELVGPRIVAAGPAIESGQWLRALEALPVDTIGERMAEVLRSSRIGVDTADEARAAVRRVAAGGFDLVKVRTSPPRQAYLALLDEARRLGLHVVAHAPETLSFGDAVRAGLRTVEHVLTPGLTDHDLAALADAQLWLTPTLVATDRYRLLPPERERALLDDQPGARDARWTRLSARTIDAWREQVELKELETPLDWPEIVDESIERAARLAREGVGLLAGSDLGAPFVHPGSGLHDELEMLADRLSLNPRDTLLTATRNAAESMGLGHAHGVVRPGAVADLVLLRADPLLDISNARDVDAVILGGRLLDRAALDGLTGG